MKPDRRYRVRYEDGHDVAVDLEDTGLRELWVASDHPSGGHTDQPCSVVGTVRLAGETIDIDCLGMRDRTWSPRPDDRVGGGTGYTYGIGSSESQFLMLTRLDGNSARTLNEDHMTPMNLNQPPELNPARTGEG